MRLFNFHSLRSSAFAFLLFPAAAFGGVQQQWIASIAGIGTNDTTPAVRRAVVDGSGNSYVAGRIDNGGGTGVDGCVSKISSTGTVLWTASYAGYSTTVQHFDDVVVDASGNVYAAGYDMTPVGLYEAVVIKLDSTGAYSSDWADTGDGVGVRRFGDDTVGTLANHLVLDGTGVAVAARNCHQLLLLRITSTGNLKPVLAYSLDGLVEFTPFVAKDASGNFYLAGTTGQPDTEDDYTLVKFDSSGQRQWAYTYSVNTTTLTFDLLTDLTVDTSGNCYLTGQSTNAAGTVFGMATVKVSSAGAKLWAVRGTGSGIGSRVTVDGSGNVYICGQDSGLAGLGMVVWKYTSGGVKSSTWATTGNGVGIRRIGGSSVPGVDLVLSSGGDLYVTGSDSPTLTTAKITASNGTVVWTDSPSLPGGTDSVGLAVNIGSGGHLIVTGIKQPSGFPNQTVVLRYTP